LSEIQNVFAEVSICPGTVKLLQKSLRETHFEATATCFEFPWQIRRKSRIPQFGIAKAWLPPRTGGWPGSAPEFRWPGRPPRICSEAGRPSLKSLG